MSRVLQLKERLVTIGRFSVPSHVLLVNSPALSQRLENPEADGTVTGRICWSITAREYETLAPIRWNNSRSTPSSVSLLISGLRSLLPSCAGLSVPGPPVFDVPIVNVSYCALKRGR